MKVLAGTSAVVVLLVVACGVQTQPVEKPNLFWMQLFRNMTADVCQDNKELCKVNGRRCFGVLKPAKVDTQEAVNTLGANMTECAGQVGATEAEFSSLTPESFKDGKDDGREFDIVGFMSQYGVARHYVGPIVECVLEMTGDRAILRTCLVTSVPEST